jgi:hypothetical protein
VLTRTIKLISPASAEATAGTVVTFFSLAFRHLDNFVKRDKSGPRTCFLQNYVYLDLLPARHQTCTVTLVKLKKLCTWTAKNAPCFAYYGLRNFVPRFWFPTLRPPCAQQRLLTLLPGRYRQNPIPKPLWWLIL